MSLDMTMGRRAAALDAAAAPADAEAAAAAPAAPAWLRDVPVVAATAFGVLLSSLFGVLLFLR